jgi:hypothetical protein
MKKLIIIALIIIMLAGCGPSQKVKVDYSPTYVAQTVEAWEESLNQSTTTSAPANTPIPMPKSTPTQAPSLIDQIAGALEFGYCPEGKTRKAISDLRATMQSSDTEPKNDEVQDISTLKLFESEEERAQLIIKTNQLISEIESIPVPECLDYAKLLYLKAVKDMKTMTENISIQNDDGSWFGELFKISITSNLADEELNKIEQCLPNCEKQ